jgi:hypothetical protein
MTCSGIPQRHDSVRPFPFTNRVVCGIVERCGLDPFATVTTAYGYVRVNTLDQDLAFQCAALRAVGCWVIRAKKASGTRRGGRTEQSTERTSYRSRRWSCRPMTSPLPTSNAANSVVVPLRLSSCD